MFRSGNLSRIQVEFVFESVEELSRITRKTLATSGRLGRNNVRERAPLDPIRNTKTNKYNLQFAGKFARSGEGELI